VKANAVPEFLSVREVAVRLGYSRNHVTELCREGKIPARKIFGHWRIRPADLAQAIEEAETAEGSKR
jgi:excisionase family DNA binding protein